MDRRLAENVEYQYVLEDVKRAEKRIEENAVSLNRAKREAETKELEALRELRKKERIARFAEIREAEKGLFTVYGLTQDNVHDETLTLREDLSREQLSGMMEAEEELDPEAEALRYPHRFDPLKREAIEIMKDYVTIDAGGDAVTSTVNAPAKAGPAPN